MTDSNYQQVFNYFRHCYFLTQTLLFEDRKPYLEKMNELLQETWYDFIWRTDLSSEVLVKMQAAKENLLKQSLEDISYNSKKVSATIKDSGLPDWMVISLCMLFVFGFIIIAIFAKIAISSNLRSPSYSEHCTSEIDVRRMNLEPPRISPSSSENHVVYYETHFLTCMDDSHKECSIPSQIHIKMCCSREDCNRNTEIVMQKCKIHNRPSRTELCRNRLRQEKVPLVVCSCKKKNNIYSKIFGSCFNFLQVKLFQDCTKPPERTYSLCMTSSGVSMSDEFVPVFQTVRQLRLKNEKEINKDSSLSDTCKSTFKQE